MNRNGHEDVGYFVGTEVEHTPAYGMPTLFVVGVQPARAILDHAIANQVEHIYFGANQSFPKLNTDDYSSWHQWEVMVLEVLQDEKNYMCTLDIDVACVEGLAESALIEHNNFIPMISVKLPYMKLLGYNATIKLDDRDFAATNPGVWCHNLHDLQNRDRYTPWSKYTKDKVLA
jgi:hypothetical protein